SSDGQERQAEARAQEGEEAQGSDARGRTAREVRNPVRFLIHGNSPTADTGYGIQIGQLARQLKADGHEVACSSTYGEQGGTRTWNDIRVYGSRFDSNGNDILHMHADHWFGDEPGWIITCMDVWVLKNPLLADYNIAAWVPVDHWPLQANIREFFHLTGA